MMMKATAFLAFAMVAAFCFTSGEAQALTAHGVRHHRAAVRAHANPHPVARAVTATARVATAVAVSDPDVWVPGHYETVTDTRVVVPGHYENQYVAPKYETVVEADGSTSQVLVEAGHYTRVWVPAVTDTVTRQVWIPGHYED